MSNSSMAGQNMGYKERMLISCLILIPCLFFFTINIIMLITLRSKPVFKETSRYILLLNLLFGDTTYMLLSQVLYFMANALFKISYPACGFLVASASLTSWISPLTLVVMSMERYVAVCYPLRHATIVTYRTTGGAIVIVWSISSLNTVILVVWFLKFPFHELETLQMDAVCNTITIKVVPELGLYMQYFSYLLFSVVGAVTIFSFIRVIITARVATKDKNFVVKVRNTLLLHLAQLCLTVFSTLYNNIIMAFLRVLNRLDFIRVQNLFYVFIFLLPRCLCSFIYGLRDQNIRPVLFHYLLLQKLSVSPDD